MLPSCIEMLLTKSREKYRNGDFDKKSDVSTPERPISLGRVPERRLYSVRFREAGCPPTQRTPCHGGSQTGLRNQPLLLSQLGPPVALKRATNAAVDSMSRALCAPAKSA